MSRFEPKSILCLLDLSSASPIVLRWAELFAETYHARLEILHAEWLEYPAYFLPSQTDELIATANRSRASLHEGLQKLVGENIRKGIPYEITVLEGHPVGTILKHAGQREPGLTVMGSHGRTGLARMRLGSVAEDILQQAENPTLVVRLTEGRPVPSKISRILCPVNFADFTNQSLVASAEIAVTFGAQLVVMQAEEEVRSPSASHMRLCEGLPRDLKGRCDLVEVVRYGRPAEQILLAAREYAVDMITLTSRHRGFLDSTVLGTTTERVLRHADVGVFVLPVAAREVAA